MKPRNRFTPGDLTACAPLLCLAVFTVLGLLASQLSHWPWSSRPDPGEAAVAGFHIGGFMYLATFLVLMPLATLAPALLALNFLFVILGDVAERIWRPANLTLHLARLVVATGGAVLFWSQLGSLRSWLLG